MIFYNSGKPVFTALAYLSSCKDHPCVHILYKSHLQVWPPLRLLHTSWAQLKMVLYSILQLQLHLCYQCSSSGETLHITERGFTWTHCEIKDSISLLHLLGCHLCASLINTGRSTLKNLRQMPSNAILSSEKNTALSKRWPSYLHGLIQRCSGTVRVLHNTADTIINTVGVLGLLWPFAYFYK